MKLTLGKFVTSTAFLIRSGLHTKCNGSFHAVPVLCRVPLQTLIHRWAERDYTRWEYLTSTFNFCCSYLVIVKTRLKKWTKKCFDKLERHFYQSGRWQKEINSDKNKYESYSDFLKKYTAHYRLRLKKAYRRVLQKFTFLYSIAA